MLALMAPLPAAALLLSSLAYLEVLSLDEVLPDPRCVSPTRKQHLHGTAGSCCHPGQVSAAARGVGNTLVLASQGDEGVDRRQPVSTALHHCLQVDVRGSRVSGKMWCGVMWGRWAGTLDQSLKECA